MTTRPAPAASAVTSSASGRTSATTGPAGGRRAGHRAAGAEQLHLAVRPAVAGTRFIVPTNSATNAVAGRS